MTMLLVTPGKFDMGADHLKDSRPVHAVKVKPYYLGEFEVTQAQWRELMGADPSTHKDDAESGLPVETVSWEDCQAAVQKLNERVTGGGFRLPTEAEWEYACRAGSEPLASAEALGEFAWFEQNTELPAEDGRPFKDFQFFSSRPVGTKKSNPWGFHDMQGNVSEWCSSVWRPYPFDPSGDGEDENDTPMRLLRGGNFGDVADLLHPSLAALQSGRCANAVAAVPIPSARHGGRHRPSNGATIPTIPSKWSATARSPTSTREASRMKRSASLLRSDAGVSSVPIESERGSGLLD